VFGKDPKRQGREVPSADSQPPDVIISPDARRAQRVPPGQARTEKWAVLDASGPPAIDLGTWRLRLGGLVAQPAEWTWDDFQKLPRVKVFADFHCVTRWSRLGNLWEGVSTRELVAHAGGVRPEARFVVAYATTAAGPPICRSITSWPRIPWSLFCTMASQSPWNTAARPA
jgi:DMSO/TMAO reductase YedYZ molybdopterin-dependent catalytic subunit